MKKQALDLKSTLEITKEMSEKIFVIPPARVRYLSEIAESNRSYDKKVDDQVIVAQKLYGIHQTIESITNASAEIIKTGLNEDEIISLELPEDDKAFLKLLFAQFEKVKLNFDPYNWEILLNWQEKVQKYKNPIYTFKVRNKEIHIETHSAVAVAHANT